MISRGLFVLLTVSLGWRNVIAQNYPAWFLHQGTVNCSVHAVGYAEHSPWKDSSISYALQNAATNAVVYTQVIVKGEQTFWGTEAGKYRMSSSTQEVIDEDEIKKARSILKVIDFTDSDGCMIVLAVDTICAIPFIDTERITLTRVKSPRWTEEIPKVPGYIYAVGLAPNYYYQSSSWNEAEWMARRNLARSMQSKVQGVQKSSSEGQSLEHLSSDVILRNVEVVERWLDTHEQIFYVLIRTKVQ